MFPVVIYETAVHLFNFYHEGVIYQAMSHHTKLYRLVKAFDLQHRSQAYSIGCQLAHQGVETVITVSQHHYKVWVDVRSHRTLGKLECTGESANGWLE